MVRASRIHSISVQWNALKSSDLQVPHSQSVRGCIE